MVPDGQFLGTTVEPDAAKPALTRAPRISLAVPEIAGREWEYVKECLDGGWVSSVGPFVDRFEAAFAARLGASCAVATVNGTSALHIALLVAGVQPDDEVLVSDLTFIAPANAVRYAGAWPVFVDAEPESWQMDVTRLAAFLEGRCRRVAGKLCNAQTGRRIGAILPVHLLGHPVDMDPLLVLSRKHGLPVIEDAAESLGAEHRGRPVGRFGRLACFSFNGNKVMTTGGGGMIVTDDPALADRARYLTTVAKEDVEDGSHGCVGYNYRLTNLQAAVGCAQLERLDDMLAAKRRIAERYRAAFADLPGVTVMPEASWARSTFWLYSLRIDESRAACSARALRAGLRAAGIDSRGFWQPMHRSPAHAGAEVLGGAVAERLYRECLSIPCSSGLSEEEQDRVIDAIRGLLAS